MEAEIWGDYTASSDDGEMVIGEVEYAEVIGGDMVGGEFDIVPRDVLVLIERPQSSRSYPDLRTPDKQSTTRDSAAP